eukprot:Tamp_33339.p1 GENE.Tamp_33339~~Tamp_33339.p1  ORF type:complete len:182 (-),score=9.71 Tamp_33339:20-565(-)
MCFCAPCVQALDCELPSLSRGSGVDGRGGDRSKWEEKQEEGTKSERKGGKKGGRGNDGNTQSSACTHGACAKTRTHKYTLPHEDTHRCARTHKHTYTHRKLSYIHSHARAHPLARTLTHTQVHLHAHARTHCSSPQAGLTRSSVRDQRRAQQPAHRHVRVHQEPRHEHASRALASHVSVGP